MNLAADFRWGQGYVPEPGQEFPKFVLGRRILYIRRDLGARAATVFARMAHLGHSEAHGVGNRHNGYQLSFDDGIDLFARHSRRGGLVRFILNDIYFGARPRPVRELAVAAEARRRSIPVAEPLGAMVEWKGPIIYRGFFLTRAMSGMTLWEFMRTDDEPLVRRHVLEQARRAIDTMHQQGLMHADLNLHNLFVTKTGESFAVVILDLDKARLFRSSLPSKRRRLNFNRLIRSAHKLDPNGKYLDSAALSILTDE